MKKLFFLLLLLIPLTVSAQIFKPVAPFPVRYNLRTNSIMPVESSKWQMRFDATVQLSEVVYNKSLKEMQTNAVFGIGPAIGLQHYTAKEDGTPFNNYGFGAGILLGEQMKIVLQANLMQYFKVGFTVTPNPEQKKNIFPVGLFFGGGITF